ncbi:glycosyltransferase [Reichenbachiella ulvae]|uniref:Family 2 glycosyl transferase n=1 Tax=Reichenbachiella ulvae TaxID=2980104 RepID=A0ABT3CS81_9BACT|nr:family 2 glycosyl transferase [Reichenbachiella ulvae]MCV9386359.1 family 2 glycosyl transferase [Reichenbachiella ulvae]
MNLPVYLKRYAYPKRYLTVDWKEENPDLIVVLPAHHEPDLIVALESLEACAVPVGYRVSVITVINASAQSSEEIKSFNEASYTQALKWSEGKRLNYHFILENELPPKHAGVGLARKIGMDEAARAFVELDRDGVILCYDADSTCSTHLIQECIQLFESDKNIPGCSIYYEHPLEGELPADQYIGIVGYELHLRYYIDALKWAGFPYAFQTIGSSMAVRTSAYMKQGGMNRRKAGEDFYFLHRIIPLGNFRDLNTACIYPSARVSDRVPFGTGKAIGDWMGSSSEVYPSYDPRVFEDLKVFMDAVDGMYQSDQLADIYAQLPESFQHFLPQDEFLDILYEINSQSTNLQTFQKRFYQWFDGFKVLKYVHHARDHFYPNVSVGEACDWLLGKIGLEPARSDREKLIQLRKWDRGF